MQMSVTEIPLCPSRLLSISITAAVLVVWFCSIVLFSATTKLNHKGPGRRFALLQGASKKGGPGELA